MDPAIKKGFVIGFLAVAAYLGYQAVRDGGLKGPSSEQHAEAPNPPAAETPRSPAAPAERPTPQAEPASPPSPGTPAPSAAVRPPAPPAAASKPAAEQPQTADRSAPKAAFDVVRVEPSGELVVAGRCAAGCAIELLSNGQPRDKAVADGGGHWAMTPDALPPGDHELGLRVTMPDGGTETPAQTVTVSVPTPPSKEVVVVLNEPDAPSRILQKPGQPAQAPAPAAAGPSNNVAAVAPAPQAPARKVAALSLGAVDAEDGRFFVQGAAPHGAKLRVYLNNALVAEPVAGADERWSLRVDRGLSPGDYVVRVDHVDPTTAKVLGRAEARFSYEPEVAAAPPPAKPRSPAAAITQPEAASKPAPPQPSAGGGSSAEASAGAAPPPPAGPTSTDSHADRSSPPTASERSQTAASSFPAPATPGPTPDAANLVVPSIETAKVRRGDSLWRISRSTYGHGRRYTVIFAANDQQIRNPNLIYPGQVLVLPGGPADLVGAASNR
jgi:nucleoid-associated protein YgaU